MSLNRAWSVIALLLASTLAVGARAQSSGPRDLDELKKEAQLRADKNLQPMVGLDPDDVREALAELRSLEPDAWATAFSRVADRWLEKARSRQGKQAAESYRRAWALYNIARWPTENSPGKTKAYARAREAFQAYGRLVDPPIEVVRVPFEGKQIVGYLRLPAKRPAPLVFGISGLDSRKEDVQAASDAFVGRGIGVFAVDMPGTGEAPLKIDVGAERMFSRALDYLRTRSEIDAARIVVRGQSWAGYWAALMAYRERDRIRGSVVHGVGIHGYFQPDWQKKGLATREYLFDLFPARASVYGVSNLDEFLAYGRRLSLLELGYLDKPSAPMLLVNGEKDTQQPIADLYLLMKHGDPKDVWVNPDGGHMGRSAQWPAGRIFEQVVLPWIERRLGAPPQKASN